jgi:transcriptional regulator with XRE-family HTH domain
MVFDETFGKTGFALRLMQLRFRELRLSQAAFAERFGLSIGMVKDAEQARTIPSRAALVLIEAIDLDPSLIERAARNAERWEVEREARNIASP